MPPKFAHQHHNDDHHGGGGGRGRGGGMRGGRGGGGRGGGRGGRGGGGGGRGGSQARAADLGGGAFGGSNNRKKSLLIGINYAGTKSALRGCQEDVENVAEFLQTRGYPSGDQRSQVIMTDAAPRNSPLYPTGAHILAAMDWLVAEPGTCNFLHYSGHGGRVKDTSGARDSGFDDTIVPVDYEQRGQIDSDTLHRHLVSALPPRSTLFCVFDCCHSGSVIELPFVYRTDDEGNLSMMDNLKEAGKLLTHFTEIARGGLSLSKLGEARELYDGARSLFHGFSGGGGGGGGGPEGLEHQDDFGQDWATENKFVTMFSGCRDDQTSADAHISGESQGAMSWAFLATLTQDPNITYIDALVETRRRLKGSKYTQIPQLSVGYKELGLDQPLRF